MIDTYNNATGINDKPIINDMISGYNLSEIEVAVKNNPENWAAVNSELRFKYSGMYSTQVNNLYTIYSAGK